MYYLSIAIVLGAVLISAIRAAPLDIIPSANTSPDHTSDESKRSIIDLHLLDVICDVPTRFAACSRDPSSSQNCNTPIPNLYPFVSAADAPYTLDELTLLQAIYLPPTFDPTRAAVLLFPGTSLPTYSTFRDTLIHLLTADGYNPVWINPPFPTTQFSTEDAQTTAEFAAYAIGYLAALTSSQVTVIAASQGTMNVQWALKYWPTTRPLVSDFIALSPDFKGTTKYGGPVLLGLGIGLLGTLVESFGMQPAAWQQIHGSAFETALNADGGDAAYVPTTSVWSSTDEIIEPHDSHDPAVASQLLLDTRAVGMAGFDVQSICRAATPPASTAPATGNGNFTYTHSGLLLHPLTYTIVTDALAHAGPASLTRLRDSGELARLCGTPGVQDPRLAPAVAEVGAANKEMANCFKEEKVFAFVAGEGALRGFAYAVDEIL